MAEIKQELDYLWRKERPIVTQQVKDAAALGDRSENAEYIYGKKRLRQIDSRVRFLSKRVEVLKVVDQLPSDINKVYFGAWVTLEDESGNETRYRLVGPDEWDVKKGYISIDSPMAKALVGKELESDVLVHLPDGQAEYFIAKIDYN